MTFSDAQDHVRLATKVVSRRSVLWLTASTAGAVLLAACGAPAPASGPPAGATASAGTASSGGPSAGAAAPKPSPQPKSGGTLRSAISVDLSSLEVHSISPPAFENLWTVYERLMSYDDKLQPQPQLAETWDVSKDFKQIKINLRKGVVWHSGREFTSDDVKYNILRVRDRTVGGGTFTNQSLWFDTIDTPDKNTIVLGSNQSRPGVYDYLTNFNMVDKGTVEGPDVKSKAVGTGPFSFVEWVPGDHISLTKNKNYWQTGRPYLDGVRVSIVKDTPAMVTQFEAGALDAIKTPPLLDFVRLRSNPEFQALAHPASGIIWCIGWNVLNAPLDNKKVRQALNYALDRKRFTDTIMQGLGRPQSLPWLPASPAYEAAKENFYTFDLDKARSLLVEAGVTGLNIDWIFVDNPEAVLFAQVYQADLAKIGVTLNVKVLEPVVWSDQVGNKKYNGGYIATSTRANLLPGTMLSSSRLSDPVLNNSGFSDDTYTKLVADAGIEADPVKAKQIYSQINDSLLDQSFAVFLTPAPPTMIVSSAVHGVSTQSFGGFGYTDAWMGS